MKNLRKPKIKAKRALLLILCVACCLGAFSLSAVADSEQTEDSEALKETEYIKLFHNYTVEEFLERYGCALPEGEEIDLKGALGSGLFVKGEISDYVTVLPGDTDGDGFVNSTDYMRLKSHCVGLFSLEGAFLKAADVDGSGEVDSTDFMRIKSNLLGTFSINMSLKTEISDRGYYVPYNVENVDKMLEDCGEYMYLLKVRLDAMENAISRTGKEITIFDLEKPENMTMPLSLTVTDVLSENAEGKFTVGQKIKAGQDNITLYPDGAGTQKMITAFDLGQLPMTELGREYIIILCDLVESIEIRGKIFEDARYEALPYSILCLAPAWTKNMNSLELFSTSGFTERYQALLETLLERYCADETISDETTHCLIRDWCITGA